MRPLAMSADGETLFAAGYNRLLQLASEVDQGSGLSNLVGPDAQGVVHARGYRFRLGTPDSEP